MDKDKYSDTNIKFQEEQFLETIIKACNNYNKKGDVSELIIF